MKCTSCNADLPDGTRFCPFCGQPVQADAAQTTQPEAPEAAPMMPEPEADPFKTQVLQDYNANASAQTPMQPYGTAPQQQAQSPYGAAQNQAQLVYGATTPMPTQPIAQQPYDQPQQPYGQPQQPYNQPAQSYGQQAYGAPVPPQGAPQYQQAPQFQTDQLPAADGTVSAKKSKKLPIIIAIVVVAVIAVAFGVCAALGVGPFAGGGFGGNTGVYKLDSNKDALSQLDAIVKDIQESGNFEGTYDVSMSMDLGSLGAVAGMSSLDYSMKGTYSMENYNPNDLSKLKMHMTMDMDVMGEKMNAVIDYADGQATVSANGQTETAPMSSDELEALFQQAGGMAYDSSTISGYIESSRIEGDTIILELDSGFVNDLLANSLAGSGLESADALVDNLEMRIKVGNGSIDERVAMDFDLSYMGATMSADMSVVYTMTKK